MTHLYADTSALVRSYMPDEPGHVELRGLLHESEDLVVTSELTRLEFRSALFAAMRSGRLQEPTTTITRFDIDCSDDGRFGVIALEPEPVFGRAIRLIERHGLHAVDAIHLAVAIEESVVVAPDDDLVFVTRDDRQAEAARAEGLAVA